MRFKRSRKVSFSKDRETEGQEDNGQKTVLVPASKTLELDFGLGGNSDADAWVHEEDFDPERYHRFMRRAVSSSVSTVQATATSTNGCVECPTVKCPACGDNYQCVMTTLTCSECPLTYCALKESSGTDSIKSSGKKNTGAIVGGVVGGVLGGIAICLWLYFYYYKRYYSKNKKKALEEEKDSAAAAANAGAGLLGSKKNKDGSSDYEDSVNAHVGSSAPASSLAGGDHSSEVGGGGSGLKRPNVAGRGSSRNKDIRLLLSDETSSVSTAAASNILPIAYIPGVKVSTSKTSLRNPSGLAQSSRRGIGNTRRNRRTKDDDAKSHITLGSSILGDLDDEGDALDSGSSLSNTNTNTNSNKNKNMNRRAQNKANRLSDIEEDGDSSNGTYTSSSVGSLVSTHELQQTAIRARPNLVQIAEEADEEEAETNTGAGTPSAKNDDDAEDDDDSLIIELDVPANHTTTTTTTTNTTTNTVNTHSTGTNVSNSTTRSSPFNDKYEL